MARKPATAAAPVPDSPFRLLSSTFWLLCRGPEAPTLDISGLGHGLPRRPLGLGELRAVLLDKRRSPAARNAALGAVLTRAQGEGGWLVALGGLMLPGLHTAASPLVRACPHRRVDIEAEMLTGLIAAVRIADPEHDGLAARLVWAARRSAEYVVRDEQPARATSSLPINHSIEPPRPWGHPELVLAEAVQHGVITQTNAELISATRLGELTLADVARTRGESYEALNMRRYRAERALVAWLSPRQVKKLRGNPLGGCQKTAKNPVS